MTVNHFNIARILLKKHEGLRLAEYPDTTGHRTIGYGWNLDAKPLPTGVGKLDTNGRLTITKAEAEGLLDQSMLAHWNELISRVFWINTLDPYRQAVLLDMAFNMGIPALLTFKHTLNLIRTDDFTAASHAMLDSKWAGQVGRRATVLSEIMRKGEITPYHMEAYCDEPLEYF